ncbi:MAG: carboxypeptidase-like regulatory domain-containing protein, partial [Acidobacteriota bacterium]
MRVFKYLCAILSLTMVAPLLSPAQTFYGSLVGNVTDSTGSAIAQASVSLTNTATGDRRAAQTAADGAYQFVNLPPGQYRVEMEKSGFRRVLRDNITVEVQSAVRIDVALQVGDLTQTIEVSEQTPLLQ